MDELGRDLSRREASDAVTGLGWRYVLGVLRANLRVGSLAEAADTAARILAACHDDAERRLLVDLRRDHVVLTVQHPAGGLVGSREVDLARRITEIAGGLGLATGAGVGSGSPRSAQVVEIAIDALDIAAVRPFWKAVLAYVDEPGRSGPEDPLVDPLGQGPAVWFQQMDAPRPQRNRIHLDVSVPTTRPRPASRPPWPPAARCAPTPRRPPSGSWPTPRATRPASPPGRAATPSRRRSPPAARRRPRRAAPAAPSRPGAW